MIEKTTAVNSNSIFSLSLQKPIANHFFFDAEIIRVFYRFNSRPRLGPHMILGLPEMIENAPRGQSRLSAETILYDSR
jgi:hypothetical protein